MTAQWIRTVALCKHYHRGPQTIKAVDDVSLGIAKGEFLGICGASGSGKSTMLNLLAGLDSPTSGTIEVDGRSLGSLSRRQLAAYRAHRVGMVFQSFNLIGHRTAQENVELALYFNNTPHRERRVQAAQVLEQLGLGDRLGHLWAFDLSSSTASNWRSAYPATGSGNPVPLFSAEGKDQKGDLLHQSITAQPAVTLHLTKKSIDTEPNLFVFFGTGQFLTLEDSLLNDASISPISLSSSTKGGSDLLCNDNIPTTSPVSSGNGKTIVEPSV